MISTIKFITVKNLTMFSLLLLGVSCTNKESEVRYIITSKVFNDFKGTKELERKLQALQQKQKYILDSLALEIKSLESLSKNEEAVQKRRDVFNQLSSEFTQSNQEQQQQFTEGIWKQINQYVADYGKEKNIKLIMGANGTGSIMYADSSLNVTNGVIEFINSKYAGN
jgi:outer membrane protein